MHEPWCRLRQLSSHWLPLANQGLKNKWVGLLRYIILRCLFSSLDMYVQHVLHIGKLFFLIRTFVTTLPKIQTSCFLFKDLTCLMTNFYSHETNDVILNQMAFLPHRLISCVCFVNPATLFKRLQRNMSLNILQNKNNQKGAKTEISHNATQNDLSLDPCCSNFLKSCTLMCSL